MGNYLWDSLSRFGDVLLETYAPGTITTSYIYGMEGILAQETNHDYQYMLKDAHGSVRLLTDAVDSVVGQYDYTAYGETLTESGTDTNYRYNGQQYDSLTGMYSLRARYYVPEMGRFISRDQHQGNYEDELNRYVYVAGNPVMFGDPSGYGMISTALIKRQTVLGGALISVARLGISLETNIRYIRILLVKVLQHVIYEYVNDILEREVTRRIARDKVADKVNSSIRVEDIPWPISPTQDEDKIILYRAVDSRELAYIRLTGFTNYGFSPNASGKYFALTLSGVMQFARADINQYDKFTITRIRVSLSIILLGDFFFDLGKQGAGWAMHFSDEALVALYADLALSGQKITIIG